MNLARISADGQMVVANNSSLLALQETQNAFIGVAEEAGNPTEEEIQSWVDEVRYRKAG